MSPRRHGAKAPRHARTGTTKGVALIGLGGVAALAGAVLFAGAPAGAEAGSTTATLTLLGIRDSNCDVQTGGTTAYVAPGGDVKFKGELAGLSIKTGLPGVGTIPISSALVTSFNYKLIVGGDKKHPHLVNGTKTFTLNNVTSGKSLSWTAASVQVNVPILGILGNLLGHKLTTIPLSASNVGLPVGGKLAWVGRVVASKDTKCGIAQVPGGEISVGPITLSIPPITNLPSQPGHGLSVPNLPTGGGGSSSSHSGNGGGGSHAPKPTKSNDGGTSGLPTTIPELVVPHVGGGDSAFGGGVAAGPDTGGGDFGPIAPVAITSTAPAPSSSAVAVPDSSPKPVDLATDSTDGGLGGAALPVLLAIVAIIALALVTATYARMYLLRKPSS